jgi:serine/threonine-protein phosphatase 2B catalytic subunit
MLVAVLNTCSKEELKEEDEDHALMSPSFETGAEGVAERREAIKKKIKAVGRMSKVYALLRLVTPCPTFLIGGLTGMVL